MRSRMGFGIVLVTIFMLLLFLVFLEAQGIKTLSHVIG